MKNSANGGDRHNLYSHLRTKRIIGCAAALSAAGIVYFAGTGMVLAQQAPAGGGPGAGAATPPAAGAAGRGAGRAGGPQPQTPAVRDVVAMQDALPDKAPAKPKQARKILVLAKAAGYVHSSIPLAAATVEQMGIKYGTWTTTITFNPADINEANLKQYDAVFLDSTTGAFLDDANDAAATADRRKALLDFVRSGKGLAGIHAATDSYHGRGGGAAGGGGRGAADANGAPAPAPAATPPAPQAPQGTWPDFNTLIGGFFKFHWVFPQAITVKIDDAKSPLTSMFQGKEFMVHDEIYTYAQDSFSRKNVHVLTSIDYSKMSDADKAKEPAATKRTDGDYALSWIRREGTGRVFYEALGHDEHIYAITPVMAHLLAGLQYVLGDLSADDSPSAK